jgi:peptidoglycan/xylan/chitin deacetylase (PgdA/CDA1 family)
VVITISHFSKDCICLRGLTLIGVISSEKDQRIIKEFFELFKTPWEFYAPDRNYDVVLSTKNEMLKTNSKLTVSYGSDENIFDHIKEITIHSTIRNTSVKYKGIEIPIYGNLYTLKGIGEPILKVKDSSDVAGLKIESSGINMILLGYDLFKEIYFLLSEGQPEENALIPTLEIHIAILRDLITDNGIPLIEIPPVPAGYDFITCLSHDIDFLGIRNHKLDYTMWGFLYRVSIGSLVRVFKGKCPLQKLMTNWKAVLSLPLVYTGLSKDFWSQIDKYTEIEKDMKSTFFVIPFKNRPGDNIPKKNAKRRSTKYDISDIREVAKTLVEQGFEIGVHGIDAWHSLEKARKEMNRIVEFRTGQEVGIRMHWLSLDENSYQILGEAGFTYDSTFGFNDAVGYKAGTAQVFKPLNTKNLLELPLHIQDTALFYPKRMNLSERGALDLCEKLINQTKTYGGVLTILWHDRSLAPERLWGDFYLNLLKKIKENKVWFATAGEIVSWFRRRREMTFEKVNIDDNKIRFSIKYNNNGSIHVKEPFAFVRIYHPKLRKSNEQNPLMSGFGYMDIPLKGETSYEINLNALNL